MSTNATNVTNPAPLSLPPAPLAPDADTSIHQALNSIIIGHTFTILLLALLIALLCSSTPCSRRSTIFILNVVAIILALAAGVMIDAHAIHSILDPQDPWPPSVNVAIGSTGVFQSILVNTILLLRLISVQPLWRLGTTRFTMMILLPILLKTVRLANVIIFIRLLAGVTEGPLGSLDVAVAWTATPYLKIEWSAQAADNAYASLALLWTFRDWGRGITNSDHPRLPFIQRIQIFARITLSTFVLPTGLSIALLVVYFVEPDVTIVLQIARVNSMFAVIGVAFASVWADGRRDLQIDLWEDEEERGEKRRSFGAGSVDTRGLDPPPIWLGYTGPPVVAVGSRFE